MNGEGGLRKGMRFVYYWRLSKGMGEIFYPRLGGSFLNNLILRCYLSFEDGTRDDSF